MSTLATTYSPKEIEDKWYKYWMEHKLFHSEPDNREPYTVVIPPPNVTGVLHMGHMLNNTIQDVLVRRARMLGKNACWVPGTDHASIATEAKVVAKLAKEGIKKADLTREQFLEHAWEWTRKHGGIILEQLKKLGASCDWERTNFTMNEDYSKSVIRVFVDLYNQGKIYRGVRMVNWDPQALTALSDEEVIYKEQQGKLYYIRYYISPLTPEGGTKSATPKYQTARNSDYHFLKELAKERKIKETEAEAALWECLRGKQLENYKFRRQHIIDDFIVDFVCLSKKLIVEVDGAYHNDTKQQEADKLRTEILESLGYQVVRFTNGEVLGNTDEVLAKIAATLENTPLGGRGAYIVVATTRPETILGDTAVCINPNDEKNFHLKGKKVVVPLINREVPIIEDEYVDVEFGTGCLKVTPAHDVNDYMLGEKYNLEVIDIFNDNGTLSEKAQLYVGQDRFEVRRQIEKDLEAAGLLEKVEPYTNKVGFSERTDVVIEPKLSMQWFLRMDEISKPALEAVVNDDVQLFPPKFKNTYRHWMENIKDWCISRQLWWGHRIPAWYIQAPQNPPQGGTWGFVVAETEEKARQQVVAKYPSLGGDRGGFTLRQDEDCLDTWFSSWLWPVSVFDSNVAGNAEADPNKDLQYYYPTSDLVTAPEILFFWVARMIIAGYEWAGGYPFKNVYLTGIVRDKLGRKMSKSLGNSPDPIELMEKYGADGVRLGMLLSSPAGNDLPFDESLCEQGRNFCNKIWNVYRLIKGWEPSEGEPQPEHARVAVDWFSSLLQKTVEKLNDDFDKYRLSEALMEIYKLYWDEFSAWYLEIVKPQMGKPMDKKTYAATLSIFDQMLRLLHPFMPFITEELWQNLAERRDGESIMVSLQPFAQEFDENILSSFDEAKQVVTNIRNIRKEKNIPNKEALKLLVKGDFSDDASSIVQRLANVSEMAHVESNTEASCASFLVKTTEFYVPLGSLINVEEERKKLQVDLDYYKKFLDSVLKKLSNEKFVSSAPEAIVSLERKKQSDAEAKISSIEEQLNKLK